MALDHSVPRPLQLPGKKRGRGKGREEKRPAYVLLLQLSWQGKRGGGERKRGEERRRTQIHPTPFFGSALFMKRKKKKKKKEEKKKGGGSKQRCRGHSDLMKKKEGKGRKWIRRREYWLSPQPGKGGGKRKKKKKGRKKRKGSAEGIRC